MQPSRSSRYRGYGSGTNDYLYDRVIAGIGHIKVYPVSGDAERVVEARGQANAVNSRTLSGMPRNNRNLISWKSARPLCHPMETV